jgi:hypothetical protein
VSASAPPSKRTPIGAATFGFAVRRSSPPRRDLEPEAVHARPARERGHLRVVGPRGAVCDQRVGRGVAAGEAGEIVRDVGDVGAAEVVDRGRVGAAERADANQLDVVGVERDRGDVAGHRQARPVCEQLHVLVDVRAVEGQCVGVLVALEDVVRVARIPLHRVAAGAPAHDIAALVAVEVVGARAAEQGVGAVAPAERVGAAAAVDRENCERRQVARCADGVVATEDVDVGGDEADQRTGCRRAGHRTAARPVTVDDRAGAGVGEDQVGARGGDRDLIGLARGRRVLHRRPVGADRGRAGHAREGEEGERADDDAERPPMKSVSPGSRHARPSLRPTAGERRDTGHRTEAATCSGM